MTYFKDLLQSSSNKNKTVWNIVKDEINHKSKSDKITLKVDDRVLTDPSEVAEAFGGYFSTIGKSSIDNHYGAHKSATCTAQRMTDKNFFFFPIMPEEVLKVIRSLKNRNGSGHDMVSLKILEVVAEQISNHVAYLVNLSVTTGEFPSVLKTAKTIPVHKKKSKDDISNYRPISLLSTLSKIIERLVFDRMMNFLNKFSIITSCQHGFRVGRSTGTAVCDFVKFVYDCLDDGVPVAGLFFDLSRAFDTLNIDFILDKLYNLGFRGVFLEWVRSFLTDRMMFVRIGVINSNRYAVDMGVPQGSILGPLIFILFVNDLPGYLRDKFKDLIKSILILQFADDTSFLVTAPNLQELRARCEMLVQYFSEWCKSNLLILNIEKTRLLYFQTRTSCKDLSLVLPSGELKSSDSVEFLGLRIDNTLNWRTHCTYVCTRLSSSFFALKRLKNILPMESLIGVYYSLAYSHMNYNTILWGGSPGESEVFISQKRIIRLIFGLTPRESCRPTFIKQKMLCFPCIYILNSLLYIRKNIHLLKRCSEYHKYDTRHKDIICLPTHRTTKFQQSPLYAGIKLFNHLPERIKELEYFRFKKITKNLLLEKCFYSKEEYFYAKLN